MATLDRAMTLEEFLSLPDDDAIERELIRGELRERPMTTRSCPHTWVMSNMTYLIMTWLRNRPNPQGMLFTGDVRIRLGDDPATYVGADFAYLPAESLPPEPLKARYIDTPPPLVIEILSPSDRMADIEDKIDEYLSSEVMLIWIINPRFLTVTVYRPDAPPQLFNIDQELSAEPHLPGFLVAVSEIFRGLDG